MSDEVIYQTILQAKRQGHPVALATVVRARGAVPRHASSKMLVFADGQTVGTVGGGEVESLSIKAAKEAIRDGQARLETFSLAGPDKDNTVGVCGGQMEVFIEPILPPPTVLVLGCGHVGQAVAHLAKWLGFRVVVSDDREELCTPEHVPDADLYLPGEVAAVLSHTPIDSQTYVVSVTRGYPYDVAAVPILLETEAPYIGIIGSQRRWATAVKELKALGIEQDALDQIHAPIGLYLGAETPEEIALSIMAQVLASRNDVGVLRHRRDAVNKTEQGE
ncbi:MAG: XdhC/CoxI family protein [Anaerolineae bacterium]|jgi:xanthine dehydrogenase accessory factor